jgi:hypothetical protein
MIRAADQQIDPFREEVVEGDVGAGGGCGVEEDPFGGFALGGVQGARGWRGDAGVAVRGVGIVVGSLDVLFRRQEGQRVS